MSFTALGSGGKYYIALNNTHLPKHDHLMHLYDCGDEVSGYGLTQTTGFQNRPLVNATNNPDAWRSGETGQGAKFDICQPYIGIYFWRRTA